MIQSFKYIFCTGQLYGIEKFWAYLQYSGHPIKDVNPQLQAWLKKFKKLEDFRVLVRLKIN